MNNFTTAKASLAVLLALTLALLPVLVQPARAEVTANYWRSWGPRVFDEGLCGMGALLLSGSAHIVVRTEGDGKVGTSVHLMATGEDLSTGDSYIFMDNWTEHVTAEGDTFGVESVPIIGRGQAPNLTYTFLYTITSDGFTLKNLVFECH